MEMLLNLHSIDLQLLKKRKAYQKMLNLVKLESNIAQKRREGNADCTKMEMSANSLDKMLVKVSKSNESYCLRILGIEASLTVVWTVASTLFAMFFFVVAVIYDKMTGNPIFGNT